MVGGRKGEEGSCNNETAQSLVSGLCDACGWVGRQEGWEGCGGRSVAQQRAKDGLGMKE